MTLDRTYPFSRIMTTSTHDRRLLRAYCNLTFKIEDDDPEDLARASSFKRLMEVHLHNTMQFFFWPHRARTSSSSTSLAPTQVVFGRARHPSAVSFDPTTVTSGRAGEAGMGEPSLQSGMAILTMGKEPCFSGKRAVILPQWRKGCIRELGRYSWNTCSSWGH